MIRLKEDFAPSYQLIRVLEGIECFYAAVAIDDEDSHLQPMIHKLNAQSPDLRELGISLPFSCGDRFEAMPRFPNIRSLYLTTIGHGPISRFLPSSPLEHLREFVWMGVGTSCRDVIACLHFFKESLQILEINIDDDDDRAVSTASPGIIPYFPHLKDLSISWDSLLPICQIMPMFCQQTDLERISLMSIDLRLQANNFTTEPCSFLKLKEIVVSHGDLDQASYNHFFKQSVHLIALTFCVNTASDCLTWCSTVHDLLIQRKDELWITVVLQLISHHPNENQLLFAASSALGLSIHCDHLRWHELQTDFCLRGSDGMLGFELMLEPMQDQEVTDSVNEAVCKKLLEVVQQKECSFVAAAIPFRFEGDHWNTFMNSYRQSGGPNIIFQSMQFENRAKLLEIWAAIPALKAVRKSSGWMQGELKDSGLLIDAI
ncbi:hypothetical protein BT69DRAFT_1355991 [Atractiella rhizophila]|nr:hypothetical protein BT69DRAFT_1355991 [Atractiella rhizophila]